MEVNYDILSVLVSQSLVQLRRFKDVSRMAQTCRLLRVQCDLLLLTPRHINLYGEQKIESFCRFMLADTCRRFPLLSQCHSLGFFSASLTPLPEPVADLMVEALRRITALRCLRFHGFERLMLSSSRLLPALAACTWIYRLEIDSLDSHMLGNRFYARLLKTLKAPLKAVKLSLPYSGEKDQHVSYNRNQDPLWLFSSFSSTLQSILLVGHATVEACSIIHVYPRLTHLTVPERSMPLVRPYIKAFPSLRVLHFDYSFLQWATDFMPTHSLLTDTLRDKSSEELRMHNKEDQLAHGSWPTLDNFMGMTSDAYVAGLTCNISTLHLIAWGGTVEGEVAAICAVFADARPTLFRLALRPPHIDNGYLAALFSQRVEAFSSLSSLELRLDVAALPFDFRSYLDTIGTALQDLPIVSLQVEIKCLAHIATRKLDEPMYCTLVVFKGDPRCYTLDGMAEENIEGRLRYLLEQIRTLRRVTIAWGRCLVDIPHRFVTIDLDSIPHTFERPGRFTDEHWQDGYRNAY